MNDLIDRAAILEVIDKKLNAEQWYPEDPIINQGLRIARKCIEQAQTVKSVSEDEMKAEIAYLEKRHREECSMLAAERDSWKARYDEILNYLSQQVQEKKIELVLSEAQSKQVAKMLDISL